MSQNNFSNYTTCPHTLYNDTIHEPHSEAIYTFPSEQIAEASRIAEREIKRFLMFVEEIIS